MARDHSIVNISLPGGNVITTSPVTHRTSTPLSPHVLVIGGGVTGLVTSWVLLDRGYRVTILSKAWANKSASSRLTSQIAGALWEYPPAVCGSHTDEVSLRRSKEWAMDSYHAWQALARSDIAKEVGVKMVRSAFFFATSVKDDEKQMEKMLEIQGSGVQGFQHSPSIISEMGVDPKCGAADAYELLAPAIDSDQAMHWLMDLVQSKGARLVTEELHDDLVLLEQSLRARFRADAIVNCTGLASLTLANDSKCYPLRGGLLRYINDGSKVPKIEHALSISADANAAGEIVFIVPRNDNTLVVGGYAQPDEYELNKNSKSSTVQRMRERAVEFLPELRKMELDPVYPFAQGLRPARKGNVRLERETRKSRSTIVHSYGHGGSGWSFSFGCAAEVADIVGGIIAEGRQRQNRDMIRARL
ncbi:FAD dependent oxidoreductase [Plenodomus tracheiphilus IPT5]|uniref:FAD dependent oxidoreductase n=1 Tax=Plenodomus tracheiphilus IPT5 TaxID=1408161 RepID=A0A6A7B8S2_9PLEO|nr:FAD dependent oxidoreductase [Plenodomus tracheiphilus IPT5]